MTHKLTPTQRACLKSYIDRPGIGLRGVYHGNTIQSLIDKGLLESIPGDGVYATDEGQAVVLS